MTEQAQERSSAPIETILARDIERAPDDRVLYEIPVSAYPTGSGKLLVNSPGSGELKDGRYGRWDTLARHMQELGLATMVTYNAPRPDFEVQLEWEPYSYKGASWNQLLLESLCHTIDWALERSEELCGSASPDLYLAGFSSGGSAVGAVAFNYTEVKRVLMLSAYDSVGDWFYEGISRFTGDIYMAFGSEDPVARFLSQIVGMGRLAASSFQARQVPNCNHRFSGAANSQALVKAFYWALGHDDSFPDPTGVPKLYE
jgi:hypothetical protein